MIGFMFGFLSAGALAFVAMMLYLFETNKMPYA